MSGSKRPSTSSLRRFITSRAYVPVAELRRRFSLDEPQAITRIARDGVVAWIGLPEREAGKLQELWARDELGMELSVEVRAPVVVGVFPMRIARYVTENGNGLNGHVFARYPTRPVSTGAEPIYVTAAPPHVDSAEPASDQPGL
jgi:hypothetical protein